jgi:hypothetical protein
VTWFSPGPPDFSTNKTDRHDITEILLKVALNTIKQINNQMCYAIFFFVLQKYLWLFDLLLNYHANLIF